VPPLLDAHHRARREWPVQALRKRDLPAGFGSLISICRDRRPRRSKKHHNQKAAHRGRLFCWTGQETSPYII